MCCTYVFASGEYNEFVDTAYNDVFALWVNGENRVLVGGDPVSINTIINGNPYGTHPELFVNNDFQFPDAAPYDTEMDGFTLPLVLEATVTSGVVNHMKLAIADAPMRSSTRTCSSRPGVSAPCRPDRALAHSRHEYRI